MNPGRFLPDHTKSSPEMKSATGTKIRPVAISVPCQSNGKNQIMLLHCFRSNKIRQNTHETIRFQQMEINNYDLSIINEQPCTISRNTLNFSLTGIRTDKILIFELTIRQKS
ncbi:MAG: hypothetical protein A3J97_13335 [Spirochaetes bacterium RIFOXYC1_FULL_54_7]|nr:MAG: hypothetical protein A3J97_13335 [Spirochaetes bacterium RIFOXYC1_FULL_54_7]